eukprot:gene53143-72583_t
MITYSRGVIKIVDRAALERISSSIVQCAVMPDSMIVLIAAVFALAGFVKGVIGLGLPTVSTDLLIMPNTDGIDIRDWKAFEPGVEAGYKAALAALDRLDRPVTEMRKSRARG